MYFGELVVLNQDTCRYFVLVLVQDCLDIFWRVVLMKEVQRLKRALRLGWEWIEFGELIS